MAKTSFRESLVKAEVYIDGVWVLKKFEDIEKGETFRTYKDYKNKVLNKDSEGHWAFVADRKSHTENGFTYQIDCHPVVDVDLPL